MWPGWKTLITMHGCTRAHAEAEAKRAIHYYEGSTAWKVKPSSAAYDEQFVTENDRQSYLALRRECAGGVA